ncbi:phosphoribosylformylglycinamidine synthase subunit PurS [Candidatus Margulisiibacteriota bacterium]
MNFKVKAYITYKDGILEPQGKAIEHSLSLLDIKEYSKFRVGKYITLNVTSNDEKEAREKADYICNEFLINPNIETFEYKIEQVKE